MIYSLKSISKYSVIALAVVLLWGCQQNKEPEMSPEEFAKHVSDLIVEGTDFSFEPALQEFEQDGVYLYDFPSKERGVFLARSVLEVENSSDHDYEAYLAVNQQAGDLEILLNGEPIYENSVSEDEYLNHVDYGLFEFKNKVALDLTDGDHQIALKFIPGNPGENRVHISFIRTDNALPFPDVELRSPSEKEELEHYGYWWLGPLSADENVNPFLDTDLSESEIVSQETESATGNSIRWDLPTLHLVKSLPGWLTYQNWHYSGGTFLDAMRHVGNQFSSLDYSDYIEEHRNFLADNIDEIEQMREDYGLIEGPFGHYFRASLLDDMGMQTVPYVNKLIAMNTENRDRSSFEFELTQRVVDHVMNDASRLPDGTWARFTPDTMSVWADDLFMGSIVLLKMHELTGEGKYLDEVIDQVIKFDNYLLDESTGIYWHGYFSRNGQHSSTKWGRANGWTMMAKTELLLAMPEDHPEKAKIIDIFSRHAEGLLAVQSEDGRWHQVLDDPSTYLETSATAMFVRAFARGVYEGWLDRDKYDKAINDGWNALTKQIDENGDIVGIVRGTPIFFSDETYANWGTRKSDPRGLGALLYASVAVEKYQQGTNE